MSHGYAAVLATPLPGGLRLGLVCSAAGVSAADFLPSGTLLIPPATPLAKQASRQLVGYFTGARWSFELPLDLGGTPYQYRVWQALRSIPTGEVVRYGELAHTLASGARAIAAACRANPLPIIVPCHRVVAATGIGGYMGRVDGPELALKQWLLAHEGCR